MESIAASAASIVAMAVRARSRRTQLGACGRCARAKQNEPSRPGRPATDDEQREARDAAEEVRQRSQGGQGGSSGGDNDDDNGSNGSRTSWQTLVAIVTRRAGVSGSAAVAISNLITIVTGEQVLKFSTTLRPENGATNAALLGLLSALPIATFDCATLLPRMKGPTYVFKLPSDSASSNHLQGALPSSSSSNSASSWSELLSSYQDTCAASNPGSALTVYQELIAAVCSSVGEEVLSRGTLAAALSNWARDRIFEADLGVYDDQLDFASRSAGASLIVLIALSARLRTFLWRKAIVSIRDENSQEEYNSTDKRLQKNSKPRDDRQAAVTSLVQGAIRKVRFTAAMRAVRGAFLKEACMGTAWVLSGGSLIAPIAASITSESIYSACQRDVSRRWRAQMQSLSEQFKQQAEEKMRERQRQREQEQMEREEKPEREQDESVAGGKDEDPAQVMQELVELSRNTPKE